MLEEEVTANLRESCQLQGLRDGADTRQDDAVVVGIDSLDLVVDEEVLDEVPGPQLRGVHAMDVLRACGVTLFHDEPFPT